MSDMITFLNDLSYISPNNEHNKPTQGDIGETSNEPTQYTCNEFKELYASANEKLYLGCDYVTRLDFMAKFTYFKVKGKLTDSIFNEMLEFFQNVFPISKGYKLPSSYYAIKKTFKTIGLGYESIHAYEHDCCLFRGDDNKDLDFCPVCNTSRWKDSNTPGKKVPKKVLRYFLIIPRLQRLYKSSHTAKEMIWHATRKCMKPSKMQHLVDGRSWKKFDTKYPDFAKEPRNVRLGLAADGFNPIEKLSQAYSMWPMILTTYNLPSWLCVETIDVASDQKFNMRAMVLWTINDFPARSSLSGWSGQGFQGMPYKDPPKEFGRDEILAELDRLPMRVKGKHLSYRGVKIKRNVHVELNWTKQSIFYELEYWSFLSLRHNLDIMHIEKNVLEAILNTLLMNDKSKHTAKARQDLESLFPNKDMKEEFLDWFGSQIRQRHLDNDKDPEVSTTSELFALACGLTWTPISINSCVVDGVRNVLWPASRNHRVKYLLFNVVFFRVKWFDTQNQGRKVKRLVFRNNMTQIDTRGEAFKNDQYILVTQVKQVFYLEDKAKPHWKVVEHGNHKKFSDGGVIVVENDPDIIHFDNSSDLPLSTSLNDLDNATLYIDGQSTEVDAPLDIIDVVDEDDDVIDGEDALPCDLADFDDKDLINVDDDGVDKMSADVARSHGGEGGGEDRPPPHYVPTGCGGCFANRGKQKPNLGGRAAGRLNTRDKTRNLSLKKITDTKGPVPIRFKVRDKQTLCPSTQFDLRPHMESPDWTKIHATSSSTCKKHTIPTRLLSRPSTGNIARAAQNQQNRAKSTVISRQGSRSLAHLRDEMRQSSTTQEYPWLIDTFFVAHTVNGEFLWDDDRRGKQRWHIPGVGRVLPARATASPSTPAHESTLNSLHKKVDFMMRLFKSDSKYSDMFSQFESGGASESGECGDDAESADDQDDEDEDGYGDT
nr:hypothetical protein [Tanacetum cinerariifolium]